MPSSFPCRSMLPRAPRLRSNKELVLFQRDRCGPTLTIRVNAPRQHEHQKSGLQPCHHLCSHNLSHHLQNRLCAVWRRLCLHGRILSGYIQLALPKSQSHAPSPFPGSNLLESMSLDPNSPPAAPKVNSPPSQNVSPRQLIIATSPQYHRNPPSPPNRFSATDTNAPPRPPNPPPGRPKNSQARPKSPRHLPMGNLAALESSCGAKRARSK